MAGLSPQQRSVGHRRRWLCGGNSEGDTGHLHFLSGRWAVSRGTAWSLSPLHQVNRFYWEESEDRAGRVPVGWATLEYTVSLGTESL